MCNNSCSRCNCLNCTNNSNNATSNNTDTLGTFSNCNCNQGVADCCEEKNWCEILSDFLGREGTFEFCVCNELVKKTGIIRELGSNYMVLVSSNCSRNRLIVKLCDLKFAKIC